MGIKTNDKTGLIGDKKVIDKGTSDGITNKGTEDLMEKGGWIKNFDDYQGI